MQREGDRVSGGGIVKFRGDVGKADRGVVNLRHKAQVGADIIRPKEERKKKKEEWWAGHPHPILRHKA